MVFEYSEIGARISARRKELQLTQETVTNLTDISTNQLSNIENSHSVPTIETLLKLSVALKVTPDYFLLGIVRETESDSIKAISQKALLCTEKQQKFIYSFISLLLQDNYMG